MQMPYVTMSDANIALMNHTFASASASYVLSQAVLRWAMPLRRHFLFIELGGTLAANDADNHAWSQRLSVGVELRGNVQYIMYKIGERLYIFE